MFRTSLVVYLGRTSMNFHPVAVLFLSKTKSVFGRGLKRANESEPQKNSGEPLSWRASTLIIHPHFYVRVWNTRAGGSAPHWDIRYRRGVHHVFSEFLKFRSAIPLRKTDFEKKETVTRTGCKSPWPRCTQQEPCENKNGVFPDDFGLRRPVIRKPFSRKKGIVPLS